MKKLEPLSESAYWIWSSPDVLTHDADTATLAIRLGLAVNTLTVHMEISQSIEDMPETAVEMRRFFVAFMATGAYTREAVNILTGSGRQPGEYERVKELASAGGAPPELAKMIAEIASGTHPAAPVLVRLRNRLVFH